MRSLPCRNRAAAGVAAAFGRSPAARFVRNRARAAGRDRAGDARCVDLRSRADRIECDRVGRREVRFVRMTPPAARMVELEIDGAAVRVPAGATLLEACRARGIDTPTLCYLENLTPVNVCRVCVVDLATRPAQSRASPRVRRRTRDRR